MSCMGLICDSLGNIVCLKGTCCEINNLREETNEIGGRITYCGIFFFSLGPMFGNNQNFSNSCE